MGMDEKICLEDINELTESYYDVKVSGFVEPDERHVPAVRFQLAGPVQHVPWTTSMRLVAEL
jgi:hypothetical protein